MIVCCTNCTTKFRVPDNRIPPEGTHVRCSKCDETFWFKPPVAATAPPGVQIQIPTRRPMPSLDGNNPAPAGQDSWFELPTLNHAAPPNTAGLSLDSLGPSAEPMGPSQPQPTEKHDLQFRDSWWGTNSLDMLIQDSIAEGQNVPPSLLEAANIAPPTISENEIGEDSILGNVLEDLATSSHFDASYPELSSKRPEDIRLEVPQSVNKPKNGPIHVARPAQNKIDGAALASVRQPAEFLLLDPSQQREDFWYTAAPMAVRGACLLFLVLFFSGLWAFVDRGDLGAQKLSVQHIVHTFFGTTSDWSLKDIRIQQKTFQTKQWIIVSGTLHNRSQQTLRSPDIRITGEQAHSRPIFVRYRCCRQPSTTRQKKLRHAKLIHNYYTRNYLRRSKIKPGESKAFTLLFHPSKIVKSIELHVVAPRKKAPPLYTISKRIRASITTQNRPKLTDKTSDPKHVAPPPKQLKKKLKKSKRRRRKRRRKWRRRRTKTSKRR